MINKYRKVQLFFLAAVLLLLSGCSVQSLIDDATKEIKSNVSEVTQTYVGDEFPRNELLPVQLEKHIDGDTSKFRINDQVIIVRYLLIDTPETVKPNTPVQPFGKEASDRTKELLEGAGSIEIMFDQGDIKENAAEHKPGWEPRYLAYVFVDGQLVQDILVREGLAKIAYVYEPNTTYLSQLQQSEAHAKGKSLGVWSNANQ